MKILICNRHPRHSLGGSEIQCDLIANYLHHQGHEVIYAAFESDQPTTDVPYPVVTLPSVHLRSMTRLCHRIGPELVYWRYNRNHFLRIALLCRALDMKTVFSVSSPKDIEPWECFTGDASVTWSPRGAKTLAKRSVQQLMSRISYEGFRHLDGVVTLSTNLLHRVPDQPFGPPRREAIYNSMEQTPVKPFYWPRPYVAWVANLKRCKNPEQFLALAARLRNLPLDFLMAGAIQHDEYAYLEDTRRLPENVFYLGPKTIAEVNGLLRGAICMAHTCDPEGFGNNFIQAWLQQTPTVSLYFDPDELIETRQIGFLSRTPERFERQVRRLYDEPKLRKKMGRKAREFAEYHFDPQRNLARYESFFEKILTH